jgi:hypothetical protein
VGCTGGAALKGALDEFGYLLRGIGRLASTTGRDFPQALNSLTQEALAPQADRLGVDLEGIGNVHVPLAVGGHHQDTAALTDLLGSLVSGDPSLELKTAIWIQVNWLSNPRHLSTLTGCSNKTSYL